MATKKKAGKKQAAKQAVKKKAPPKKKATAKKAAPKKKAAAKGAAPKKKAAAKKAAPKKKAAASRVSKPTGGKPVAAAKKPRVRRDATGHLDPAYARDLRRKSKENAEHDDDRAFLVGERREDALAEELGREFVETVTSGEDEGNELRDELVSEEVGGPFVETTSEQEFATEPDASNPVDATREPFPKS